MSNSSDVEIEIDDFIEVTTMEVIILVVTMKVVGMKVRRMKVRKMTKQGYITRGMTQGSYPMRKQGMYIRIGNMDNCPLGHHTMGDCPQD